jgi:hypothetical protein
MGESLPLLPVESAEVMRQFARDPDAPKVTINAKTTKAMRESYKTFCGEDTYSEVGADHRYAKSLRTFLKKIKSSPESIRDLGFIEAYNVFLDGGRNCADGSPAREILKSLQENYHDLSHTLNGNDRLQVLRLARWLKKTAFDRDLLTPLQLLSPLLNTPDTDLQGLGLLRLISWDVASDSPVFPSHFSHMVEEARLLNKGAWEETLKTTFEMLERLTDDASPLLATAILLNEVLNTKGLNARLKNKKQGSPTSGSGMAPSTPQPSTPPIASSSGGPISSASSVVTGFEILTDRPDGHNAIDFLDMTEGKKPRSHRAPAGSTVIHGMRHFIGVKSNHVMLLPPYTFLSGRG